MNRLHIGCGKAYLKDWVNLDFFTSVKADVYADVQAIPFPPATFDLIYACHVLEHVQRNSVVATLTHWHSLLKPGGLLRIAVPDFEQVVSYYRRHRTEIHSPIPDIMGLLYGGQNHPKNCHYVTFDEFTLSRDLVSSGFKPDAIRRWDWRLVDHGSVDDYSKCYLPHMNFENGRLMSLNLEATN